MVCKYGHLLVGWRQEEGDEFAWTGKSRNTKTTAVQEANNDTECKWHGLASGRSTILTNGIVLKGVDREAARLRIVQYGLQLVVRSLVHDMHFPAEFEVRLNNQIDGSYDNWQEMTSTLQENYGWHMYQQVVYNFLTNSLSNTAMIPTTTIQSNMNDTLNHHQHPSKRHWKMNLVWTFLMKMKEMPWMNPAAVIATWMKAGVSPMLRERGEHLQLIGPIYDLKTLLSFVIWLACGWRYPYYRMTFIAGVSVISYLIWRSWMDYLTTLWSDWMQAWWACLPQYQAIPRSFLEYDLTDVPLPDIANYYFQKPMCQYWYIVSWHSFIYQVHVNMHSF